MPAITENDENQAIVEVPGLADALRKVERSYKVVQAEHREKNGVGHDRKGRSSQMSNLSKVSKDTEKGAGKDKKMAATVKMGGAGAHSKNASPDWLNLDDLDVAIPRTRRELEEVHAQMSAKEIKESPEFRAVKRTNTLLKNAYMDLKDGVEAKY